MKQFIQQRLNPTWYHGHQAKAPFFEGWYYKLISEDEQHRFAIIPAIFINEDKNKNHAFIQVLDGTQNTATYHRFPIEQFNAKDNDFDVWLGNSHFREDCLLLDVEDEQGSFKGELHFQNLTPFPVSWTSPGIMGFFGWFPFMECNHGIVSMNHQIKGSLTINGEVINFDGGLGYIEKDWGKSFPEGYVWMQTNHFDVDETSLFGSIAVIPNFGFKWAGFTMAFYHRQTFYRFASYTGAKVKHLAVTDELVDWVVEDRNYRMAIHAQRAEGGLLLGPERTDMHMRVGETMQAIVELQLVEKQWKRIVFEGTGRNAGLEVVGDIDRLLKTEYKT